MGGGFEQSWRVRETVFSPMGIPLGEVIQSRRLEQRANGRLRVIQDCEPAAELAGHPMADFIGHHEFDLSREGAFRRYHGPAVVGGALAIGSDAMIGRGLWPVFGWSFHSWSVLLSHDRQLTGGRFFRGGHSMATIVGVASPDADSSAAPPSLGPAMAPSDLATRWKGTYTRVDAVGFPIGEGPAERVYDSASAWSESGSSAASVCLEKRVGGVALIGVHGGEALTGLVSPYGWMLEIDAVVGAREIHESIEVLDGETRTLVVLRKMRVDGSLRYVELLKLRPENER